MKKQTILPILFAILGNVFWGFSFLFIEVALEINGDDTNLLLAHRFILSTALMLLPLIFRKVRFSLKGKPFASLLVLMLMQLGYYFFETQGLLRTNSTFAGMVLAAVPLGAIVTGMLFLKEYPTKRQALFCLLPVAGIVIMTLSANELGVITPIGVLCLFLCMCCSALYKTANRKASIHFSSYERTLLITFISAVTFTIVSLASLNWDLRSFFAPLGNISYILPLLFLCVVCSILANLMVNYAASKMSVFKLASFGAISTLVSTFMGVIVLGDPVSWPLLGGAAMIIIGVQQVIRPDKSKNK